MIWSCRPCTLSSQVIEVNTFLHCTRRASQVSPRARVSPRALARHTGARVTRARATGGAGTLWAAVTF